VFFSLNWLVSQLLPIYVGLLEIIESVKIMRVYLVGETDVPQWQLINFLGIQFPESPVSGNGSMIVESNVFDILFKGSFFWTKITFVSYVPIICLAYGNDCDFFARIIFFAFALGEMKKNMIMIIEPDKIAVPVL
jgi:hypothetical protein